MMGNVHGPEEPYIVANGMQEPVKKILTEDQYNPVDIGILYLKKPELITIIQEKKGSCFHAKVDHNSSTHQVNICPGVSFGIKFPVMDITEIHFCKRNNQNECKECGNRYISWIKQHKLNCNKLNFPECLSLLPCNCTRNDQYDQVEKRESGHVRSFCHFASV